MYMHEHISGRTGIVQDIVPLAILVILTPGLLINYIFGRFQHAPQGFLDASAYDWPTWIMSIAVWAALLFLRSRIKKH